MNIISKYFDFKRKSLVTYASIILGDEPNGEKYIDAFIQTFIDTHYYHILNTYYENDVTKFNNKIIIKEMKGKMLEVFDEMENKDDRKERILIGKCYKYSFVSIVICMSSFKECFLVEEYKNALKELLSNNKSIDINNDEVFSKLASALKKNQEKERKFFANLKTDEFKQVFVPYKESKENFKVMVDYRIDQLEKSYTRDILDKNFDSVPVLLNRFKTSLNLVNTSLLKMILSNSKIQFYFLDLPLNVFNTKEELEEVISWVDNVRIKDRVVFIVNYNDYISKKSFFKNLTDYSFAICIDLSRTIVIEKRLAEIETFDLFGYVIIDGVKKADRVLVENYVIKGKEMFMSDLSVM